jgi:pre-mRNA-splicing factor 18
VVEDTYAVGQQANTMLEIQKEEEAERRRMLRKEAARQEKNVKKSQLVLFNDADDPESEAERLNAAFKAAAAKVAAEQREKNLPKEEAMMSYIKRMMAEWKQELDREAEEEEIKGGNKQAMLQYRTTEKSFVVLYERMEQSTLADDIKAALWLMVKAMKERNYLYASEIYVRLAIGNAPWPIGVTSVGIHDRSAREKISFAMNGQAHIMNDEASRKFIHGFKRLMTWVQKVYPTDPSRCLDFNATRKDLTSLKAAEKRGEVLQLAAAPHFLGKDGKVKAPSKWENVLKHSGIKVGKITEQNKDKKDSWITPDA